MSIKRNVNRFTAGLGLSAAAVLVWAVPALGHVTVSPTEAPAEGYAKIDLNVPHGCEASPTTSISVQMPDQVVSVTPQVVAGWEISTKEGELAQPVESHGETITTGVREVTWRGGPLDAHHLEVFGLSVRFAGNPGEQAVFKVVQRCQEGEEAWIEVAETEGEELDHPAPVVNLIAADDDHGHGANDSDASNADGSELAADEENAAPGSDDGDGTLPVVALVVAIAALIAAIAALMTRRRQS